MSRMSYVPCVLKLHGGCGHYLPKNEITMQRFHSLTDDVSSYIKALNIRIMKQNLGGNIVSLEKGLITNKAKINELDVEMNGLIYQSTDIALGNAIVHQNLVYTQNIKP